jgi:hypothetical protein
VYLNSNQTVYFCIRQNSILTDTAVVVYLSWGTKDKKTTITPEAGNSPAFVIS